MFMSCDRFKPNSGKSFAGQRGALACVALEHARHMRRRTQYCVASSGRRWATSNRTPTIAFSRLSDQKNKLRSMSVDGGGSRRSHSRSVRRGLQHVRMASESSGFVRNALLRAMQGSGSAHWPPRVPERCGTRGTARSAGAPSRRDGTDLRGARGPGLLRKAHPPGWPITTGGRSGNRNSPTGTPAGCGGARYPGVHVGNDLPPPRA
jgi:hypothetical protein